MQIFRKRYETTNGFRTNITKVARAEFFLVALVLWGSGCKNDSPTSPPPQSKTLEGLAVEVRQEFNLPALAVAVIHSDTIRTAVVGIRKVGTSEAVTLNDRFHLGSTTKAITATLVAKLVEGGHLRWSSTPLQIFPEWADSMSAEYRGITLAQLLSHRAGVPAFEDLEEFRNVPEFSGTALERRRAFSFWLLKQHAVAPPGTYLYSNAGYAVAAAMAERVMNESWESMIGTRLLTPCGISAGFGWPAAGNNANQPWGHLEINSQLVPHNPNDEYRIPDFIAPAGDVNMSIGDWAKFIQLHLRGLRGRSSALADSSFRFLHTPIGDYAMGWYVSTDNGVVTSSHPGSAGTFAALAVIQPARDIAVIAVTNAANQNARMATGKVISSFIGQ